MNLEKIVKLLDEGGGDYEELGYPDRGTMTEDWNKAYDDMLVILNMISNCNEKSATRCFECIDLIKKGDYKI